MGDIADYYAEQYAMGNWGTPVCKKGYLSEQIKQDQNLKKNVEELNMQTINVNQLPAFIAVVEFLQNNSGKQYDFFSNIHVKHGDTVVVDTVHGLQLATVVGVKAKSGKAGKWVVDKVNVEGYYKRREMEEKAKKLKREMEARAKQLSDIQRYQQLAAIDPEMARMLQEFKDAENQLSGLAWDGGTINLNGIK